MTRTHLLFDMKKGPGSSGSQGPSKLDHVKKQVKRGGFGEEPTPVPEVTEDPNGGWNSNCRWAYPSTSSTVKETQRRRELLRKIYGKEQQSSTPPEHLKLERVIVPASSVNLQNPNQSCWRQFRSKVDKVRKKACRFWKIVKRKKREWDKWNPNKSHPIAACIDESKLAGLKETIKPNRGILYRIMWLLVFITAIGVATKMVYNTHKFHEETPVLYAFDTREVNVENLAAPTITVCPSTAFKASSVNKATEEYVSQTNANSKQALVTLSKKLYFMRTSCEPKTIQSVRHGLGHLNPLKEIDFDEELAGKRLRDQDDGGILTKDVIPFLKNASHKCSEMLRFCSWNMESSETCEGFISTFETTGGCCSFNNMPDSSMYKGKKSLKSLWSTSEDKEVSPIKKSKWDNWTLHKHLQHIHDKEQDKNAGPLRQSDGGWPWGASFVIVMDDKDSECPQFDSSGTRISISVPGVDVDVERESIIIPPNHEVFVRIYPEVTLADEDLRTIAPIKRGCYMEHEHNLKHYNMYNQENCHRECVAEFTLKECGCVLLSYPNSEGQQICNLKDFDCVRQAEGTVVRRVGLLNACPTCLPTCSQMTLRLETTMSPYSQHHISEMTKSINKTTSLVHVFYGPKSVTAKVRKLRHSKYEYYSEAGSIYETTNDMSLMGYVRILCGSTAFIPTIIGILFLLRAYCLRCPVVCRKLSIRTFGLRKRLQVHPSREQSHEVPPEQHVEQEQVSVVHIGNEATTKNFEVFLAHSSHVVISMPPSPTHP